MIISRYKVKCNITLSDGDTDTVDYTGNEYINFEDAQEEFEKAVEEANQFGFINYAYITEVEYEDKETNKK